MTVLEKSILHVYGIINGKDYCDHHLCKSSTDLISIITEEKPQKYDICFFIGNHWLPVIFAENGKVLPSYDECLIPENMMHWIHSMEISAQKDTL